MQLLQSPSISTAPPAIFSPRPKRNIRAAKVQSRGLSSRPYCHSTQDEELREGEGHHHLSEEVRLFVPPVIEVAYSPHGQGQEHGQRCLCSRIAP
ncbi:hypothetical protein [Methanothrix sp.]|uniref:hypothetical protein n=1 Tax=Methanothrix sp. TaxID=90426 RepID=UPI001BD36D71